MITTNMDTHLLKIRMPEPLELLEENLLLVHLGINLHRHIEIIEVNLLTELTMDGELTLDDLV